MSDDDVLDDAAIVLSSSEDHDDGADALSPNQSKNVGTLPTLGAGQACYGPSSPITPSPTSLSRRSVSIVIRALTTTRRARAPRLT